MNSKIASRCTRLALRLSIALAGIVLATASLAQTTFTAGGGEIRGFFTFSSTAGYAAAYGGGLLKTTDAGASWSRIALPSNIRYLTGVTGNSSFTIISADEGLVRTSDGTTFTQVLYEPVTAAATPTGSTTVALAAVKGLGILRSTNSAVTFAPANNSAFSTLDITAVAFDPGNAGIAYAAARADGNGNGGGVYKSTDGGATWSAMTALPAGNNYVTSIVVDSAGKPYVGVLRPDANGDVYSFNGASWVASGFFFGVVSLSRDANTGTTIWGGSRGLGLASGSGTSFGYTFANDGTPNLLYTGVNASATFPGSQAALMAVKGAGIWRSAASGSPRTWSHLAMSTTSAADRVLSASGIAGSASTMLMGLRAGGVWKSTDSGVSFNPPTVNSGQGDFSFAASTTSVNPFVSIWELAASATNANIVYAASGGPGMFYFNDNYGLFRWNGSAWQGVGANAPAGAPWNGAVESGNLFVAPSYAIFGVAVNRANDALAYVSLMGPSYGIISRSATPAWSGALPLFATIATPQIRSVVTSSTASKLVALPFDDKPIYSTDSGANFTSQVSVSQYGFERIRFFSAAEDPANASLWVAGTNKGVFYSGDGGLSWSRVGMNGVFPQLVVPAVGFQPGTGIAFAGDFAGNRFCSANGGVTWKALTPLRAGINAIRTIGSSLFYLTDGAGMVREDGSTC